VCVCVKAYVKSYITIYLFIDWEVLIKNTHTFSQSAGLRSEIRKFDVMNHKVCYKPDSDIL